MSPHREVVAPRHTWSAPAAWAGLLRAAAPVWALRLAIVLGVLCALGGAAREAHAAPKRQRIALLIAADRTGQGSTQRLRAVVEAALEERPELRIVPLAMQARAARRLRIPASRRTRPDAIAQLGKAMRLELACAVRIVEEEDGQYAVLFELFDGRSGERRGEATMQLPRPRLTESRARKLVDEAMRAMAEGGGDDDADADADADQGTAPVRTSAARPGGTKGVAPAVKGATPAAKGTGAADPAGEGSAADLALEGEAGTVEPEASAGDETVAEDASGQAGGTEPAAPVTDDWQVPAFEEVQAESTGEIDTELTGRVEVQHFRFLENPGDATPAGRDSVELALGARAETEQARAHGELGIRRDFADPDRDRIDLLEGYGEIRGSRLSLRAGRTIESWGTGNLYQPSDILNPVDLRDPLRPEKLGVWLVRAGLLAGPLLLEGYYLPVFAAHTLPLPTSIDEDGHLVGDSRWVTGQIPLPPGVPPPQLGGVVPVSNRLEDAQGAVRLAATLPRVDLAISYSYLYDRIPWARLEAMDPNQPPTVFFAYRRQHVATLEAETTIGRYRIAAEAAAFVPGDKRVPGAEAIPGADRVRRVQGVVGIDFEIRGLSADHRLHVFVDGAFAHAWRGDLDDDPLGALRVPFRRALLGRLEYRVSRKLELELNGARALDDGGLLLQPALKYVVSGMVTALVGATWIGGPSDSLLGAYRDNARLLSELKVQF